MEEAQRSTYALQDEIKNLYGELGTMLATKQKEIQSNSRFVITPHQNKRASYEDDQYVYMEFNLYIVMSHYKQSHLNLERILDLMSHCKAIQSLSKFPLKCKKFMQNKAKKIIFHSVL